MQEAFWEQHGLQCGYCTPGMIMAAADLLQRNPDPSEDEVREALAGNLCRCTGYHNIVKAVLAAAKAPTRRGHARRRRATRTSGPGGRGMSDRQRLQRPLRRPGAEAQGGPALHHRPGHLHRRHHPPGHAATRAFVRSPEAHATDHLDRHLGRARARPASTPSTPARTSTLAAGLPMAWVPPGVEVKTPEHWPLAKGEVKHVGQAVAVVIGDDKYAVVDAAEDVVVEYDPLPVVVDPEAALQGRLAARPRGSSAPTRRTSGASAPRTWTSPGRRPTSSSSGGSSTTARPARRSSRAPASPSTAPAT